MIRRLICRLIGHDKLYFMGDWVSWPSTQRIGWRCDRCGVES